MSKARGDGKSKESVVSKLPKFSSEILLQQAIAGLLNRMPNISDVQVVHGAQEYGKDIVFQADGPLGEHIRCACAVKNSKVTGTVDSSQGARGLLFQIEQALDTPFIDENGEEARVHRVYVMCPEDVSQGAINSIKGKLTSRSGQIRFFCGGALFSLFKSHWANFFFDEYTAIETYLDQLSKQSKTSELADLLNVYSLGSIEKKESSIYVSRSLLRVIPRYASRDIVHFFLPSSKELMGGFARNDLKMYTVNSRTFKDTANHFKKWDLFDIPTGSTVSSLQGDLTGFVSLLQQEWKESAGRRDSHDQVSGTRTINIPDDQKVKFRSIKKIIERLRPLREKLEYGFQDLIKRQSQERDLPSASAIGLDLLSDSKWLSAFAFDDSLNAAPSSPLQVSDSDVVTFSEKEIRQYTGHLLIVGSAGFGKTLLCRRNALSDAESFRTGKGNIFPIYVPLHTLGHADLTTFEETFLANLDRSALLSGASKYNGVSIRLYLDGLDEIPSDRQRMHVVELVREGLRKHQNIHVFITSRDYIFRSWLVWMPRLRLGVLSDEAVDSLIKKWFKEDKIIVADFVSQLESVPAIRRLMNVPLLSTLVILVFRQTKRLPDNKSFLYVTFIDLLSGGWDLAKGVIRSSHFMRALKTMVLADLAFRVHCSRERFFESDKIVESIWAVMIDRDRHIAGVLIDELVVDGVVAKSGGVYYFSHHSFQEFLAAKYMIGDPSALDASRALSNLISGEDWWREVVYFYIGLSENPVKITKWLRSELKKNETESAVVSEIFESVKNSFPDFNMTAFLQNEKGRDDSRTIS